MFKRYSEYISVLPQEYGSLQTMLFVLCYSLSYGRLTGYFGAFNEQHPLLLWLLLLLGAFFPLVIGLNLAAAFVARRNGGRPIPMKEAVGPPKKGSAAAKMDWIRMLVLTIMAVLAVLVVLRVCWVWIRRLI